MSDLNDDLLDGVTPGFAINLPDTVTFVDRNDTLGSLSRDDYYKAVRRDPAILAAVQVGDTPGAWRMIQSALAPIEFEVAT